MTRKQSSWLAASIFLLGHLACGTYAVQASDFDLGSTAPVSTTSGGSTNTDEGLFGRKKLNFSFDSRIGYDSNTLAQPDIILTSMNAAGKQVRRDVGGEGSTFINFDLGATYLAATSRSTLSVGADVGLSYFFDRPGRNYDINGGLSAALSYKLTPRLFLQASTYNAFVSQGDYGASNLTNFNGSAIGGVRTPGTTDARNGDYFYTTDTATLAFQLSPRISLVTGYSVTAFAYEDEPYITVEDRVEQFFSEEVRYLLLPNLTFAGDYRFSYVDYFGVNNDSITNFLLAGVDYVFGPRLRGSVRAGVEFRSYLDSVGDETSPYAEASVSYNLARRTTVDFTARYGIEEGGLTTDVNNSNTIRLGISVNQQFTARINGYASFYFTHSDFQNPAGNLADFKEETYDVAIGGRYAITRYLSVEAGYTYSDVQSQIATRAYDRNRVFGGLRIAF